VQLEPGLVFDTGTVVSSDTSLDLQNWGLHTLAFIHAIESDDQMQTSDVDLVLGQVYGYGYGSRTSPRYTAEETMNALSALARHNGDVVNAIMELTADWI